MYQIIERRIKLSCCLNNQQRIASQYTLKLHVSLKNFVIMFKSIFFIYSIHPRRINVSYKHKGLICSKLRYFCSHNCHARNKIFYNVLSLHVERIWQRYLTIFKSNRAFCLNAIHFFIIYNFRFIAILRSVCFNALICRIIHINPLKYRMNQ
jgi:hypothetical protein